ncbi:transposase [Streptomyces sp. NPDC000410]|uniref:RNA-guided endonuclease InsQ/TnpB family protein n=1 Tax=Streptomyces sp. NPDC000410 TaxID=3154254 RepID=UPI00332AE95D
MKADRGRKYRAYPTSAQDEILTGWGHDVRALWNLALEHRMMVGRKHDGTWVWSAEQCLLLTEVRKDPDDAVNWLSRLPAQAGQQVLRHLDRAFVNMANPDHPAGPPVFKRRGTAMSISFPGQSVRLRKLNRHWAEVRIPKLGWVRFRLSRSLGGAVRNCVLVRDGLGWHVAFGVHTGAVDAPPNGKPGCGVDFGVAVSAYVSTENKPRLMRPTLTPGEQRRLRGLQQRKSRQLKHAKKHNGGRYSKRLRKTITQIAALTSRQARRRLDFTHKLTTDLAKNHGFVGIEDLRVTSMTATARGTVTRTGARVKQKAGLNRAILDNMPGERRRQLEYKTRQYGSELRPVPPGGTSQSCPSCGERDPQSRVGCGREFACVHCGFTGHADKTASIEIEARARRTGGTVTKSTRRPRKEPSRHRTPVGRRTREPAAGSLTAASGATAADPVAGPSIRVHLQADNSGFRASEG